MSDYAMAGDEMKPEFAEFEKANRVVVEDPDDFDGWEKVIRLAETLEGGLNRNSSPQAIAMTRNAFDRFLAKFPLLFGYWKKYADLEFSIAGTEAAEMVRPCFLPPSPAQRADPGQVYERGIASINISVDLWTNYCAFKVETSHDPDIIRE
jgi:pre-mRNA-processing factor 39